MEKQYYTWEQFFNDSKILAEKLKHKDFKSLIIITRGGLFLGGMISEYLNLRLIHSISVKLYQEEKKDFSILNHPEVDLPNPLIIDDICDSGETLQFATSKFNAPSCTLFFKPEKSITRPDYFLHTTSNWIVFPWEVEL